MAEHRNIFQRLFQTRSSPVMSVGDPAFAGYVQMSVASMNELSEQIALRQPAMWRAVNLISGTIASLPLKSYRNNADGEREQVKSFLDNPGAMGLSRMQWVETIMAQLLMNGEVGLIHIYNNGGALVQLLPIPRLSYQVFWTGTDKEFKVSLANGTEKTYGSQDFTQIMGLTLDGLRGISPLNLFRKSIQLAQAQELAANRHMVNGMLVGGLVTPDEDMEEDDAKAIKQGLDERVTGADHAGGLVMVNRKLTFTPWVNSAVDSQFIQGREFSVVEVSRMFGIPPHLLGATEKQTSFGVGLQEQNSALHRYTLAPWTTRIEEALSNLLPQPRFVEFDYSGLLQGTSGEEINLLLAQMEGGLITPNEARAIRNLPPLAGGDELRTAPPPPPVLDKKLPGQGGPKVFSIEPPKRTATKRTTRLSKSSNGELLLTTQEN